jgi:hypothetical protein
MTKPFLVANLAMLVMNKFREYGFAASNIMIVHRPTADEGLIEIVFDAEPMKGPASFSITKMEIFARVYDMRAINPVGNIAEFDLSEQFVQYGGISVELFVTPTYITGGRHATVRSYMVGEDRIMNEAP